MPFIRIVNGKIRSIKLEYNLVEHCNYSCDECSHFSPYLGVRYASIETFKKDLAALERVYHVDRFRFVGGEPLLHKDILAFIQAVRESGIADKIQICTNGSLLHKADDEVFQNIDMLSISWYPDRRCDQSKIDLATERCQKYHVVLKVERIDSFRTMQIDQPNTNRVLVDKIYRSCQIAHSWGCQTFYDGYFYLCSRPLFTRAYLRRKGQEAPDFAEVDGVPLHDESLLPRLVNYLQSKTPLLSCEYCLGTVGKYVPWKQVSAHERRAPALIMRVTEETINRIRMGYLISWTYIERAILKAAPSLKVSRALNILKNASIRD